MFDNIPQELKQYPNWVVWDLNKIPYSAIGGRRGGKASSTNPATWCSFDEAVAAHKAGECDGIGFVFTNSPFVGVDVDKVIGDDGKILP